MTGVVLFAHNNGKTDYYKMASYTAARIEKFLGLPTTVITDRDSVTTDYAFDNIIYIEPDTTNTRNTETWINKGRYQVFELSPYDNTIVLDTDYMINSNKLLSTLDYPSDFVCYEKCVYFFRDPSQTVELLSRKSFETLWATVMRFTKTARTEQLFGMIEMVQKNYNHYSDIHGFAKYIYRNDYALTIALRTVNGQYSHPNDYIVGRLHHVGLELWVERVDDTTYKVYRNKEKRDYILVRDYDFHMMNKANFMELAL